MALTCMLITRPDVGYSADAPATTAKDVVNGPKKGLISLQNGPSFPQKTGLHTGLAASGTGTGTARG